MHRWGDKDFDWESLGDAIIYIHARLKKWRISVNQSKEKFGTARIYCHLGWHGLLSITHPGYCWYPYPKWLVWLDIYVLSVVIRPLNFIVMPIHKFIYMDTYRRACKKYPHIVDEICCCADYVDLLGFYRDGR